MDLLALGMMKNFFALCFVFFGLINLSQAQIGGQSTYSFLNLSPSARIAAIGGDAIAIQDGDVNMALRNPALISKEMNQDLALNVVRFYDQISFGSAAYAFNTQKYGMVALGVRYISYGEFIEADETGRQTGTFRAGEYAIQAGYAYALDSNWSVGLTNKWVFSNIAGYTSLGTGFDAGLVYHKPVEKFTAALLIKNMGLQLSTYAGNREPLPFEVQLGLSKRLKYMPLRWTLTLQHLQKLDLTFRESQAGGFDPFTGEPVPEDYGFGEKILRHVVIGAEFLPESNFTFRFGLNYRRRQELKVEPFKRAVGYGFGVGLKLGKFHLHYGRSRFHLAGVSNHFSITTNLGDFYKGS